MARYRTPKDLAESMARRRKTAAADDGYVRESFALPREEARARARAWLNEWPAEAYMSGVGWFNQREDGQIEFRMKRLRSSD